MGEKRLRVAFLSEFIGVVDRGVETYVLEVSERLKKFYDVVVIAGRDSYSLKKILGGRYDLVIPTNGRLQSLAASLGRLIQGYKIIISGQSGIGKDDIWNIFVTVPDVYVALTDYELNWAKNWAWRTKLVKIPNGVDLIKFSADGQKAKINLKGRVVLSVGALHWYKYHQRSIYAVSKTLDCSLLIIGRGEEQKKLEDLGLKLLSKDRFKIMQVDFSQMPQFYRAADLFVLPSWIRESFGIVYVEAMACNLPVVAPDDPPRREIIGNAGILTEVENPNKYAAAILQALSKKWGNKPRKQAEKFSWDKIAEQYEDLIDSLIK